MPTGIALTLLGIFFMVLSFIATSQSGEFGAASRLQFPISRAQRMVLFIAGILMAAKGVHLLIT